MRVPVLPVLALSLSLSAPASAQVTVVEESEAQGQIVERGQVRQGRGGQLGAYLISPVYATAMRRDDGSTLPVLHPGGGVGVRGGWEFPVGLALELYAELGFHGLDNPGDAQKVMAQLAVGGTGRFLFFNPSAFVPFLQASVGIRALGFEWPDGRESDGVTLDVGGGIGAQIEITAEVGFEAGLLVAALLPGSYFSDAILAFHPFAGITFFTDPDGNV